MEFGSLASLDWTPDTLSTISAVGLTPSSDAAAAPASRELSLEALSSPEPGTELDSSSYYGTAMNGVTTDEAAAGALSGLNAAGATDEAGVGGAAQESVRIVFTQQPRPEVAKSVYFDLRFRVVMVAAGGGAVDTFSPAASLRYEDGSPVQTNILDGGFKLHDGECRMRLRVNELSKNHRNQRFVVQVEARGWFGIVIGVSTPLRVLSKTSIVQSHMVAQRQQQLSGAKRRYGGDVLPTAPALGTLTLPGHDPAPAPAPAADSAAAAGTPAAGADVPLSVQQIAALRRMCDAAQGAMAAALDDMRAQVGALQAEMRSVREQLATLVATLQPRPADPPGAKRVHVQPEAPLCPIA